MLKLIKAAFSRQLKNIFLPISAVIAIADGFMYASNYANIGGFTTGSRLFASLFLLSLCACRFISPGTTDNAYKNKLINGYTRTEIFVSEYIVSCVYALFMATLTAACAILPVHGMMSDIPAKYAVVLLVGIALAWLLTVSIVFVLTALIPRKEFAILITVLVVWVCCVPVAELEYKINQPEYNFTGDVIYLSWENIDPELLAENEHYMGSPKREITRILFEMTPSGQLLRYNSFFCAWERVGESLELIESPFFSTKVLLNYKEFLITAPCLAICSIVLCFLGGLALFRKREFS